MSSSHSEVLDGWADPGGDTANSEDSDLELFGEDHAGDLSTR